METKNNYNSNNIPIDENKENASKNFNDKR